MQDVLRWLGLVCCTYWYASALAVTPVLNFLPPVAGTAVLTDDGLAWIDTVSGVHRISRDGYVTSHATNQIPPAQRVVPLHSGGAIVILDTRAIVLGKDLRPIREIAYPGNSQALVSPQQSLHANQEGVIVIPAYRGAIVLDSSIGRSEFVFIEGLPHPPSAMTVWNGSIIGIGASPLGISLFTLSKEGKPRARFSLGFEGPYCLQVAVRTAKGYSFLCHNETGSIRGLLHLGRDIEFEEYPQAHGQRMVSIGREYQAEFFLAAIEGGWGFSEANRIGLKDGRVANVLLTPQGEIAGIDLESAVDLPRSTAVFRFQNLGGIDTWWTSATGLTLREGTRTSTIPSYLPAAVHASHVGREVTLHYLDGRGVQINGSSVQLRTGATLPRPPPDESLPRAHELTAIADSAAVRQSYMRDAFAFVRNTGYSDIRALVEERNVSRMGRLRMASDGFRLVTEALPLSLGGSPSMEEGWRVSVGARVVSLPFLRSPHSAAIGGISVATHTNVATRDGHLYALVPGGSVWCRTLEDKTNHEIKGAFEYVLSIHNAPFAISKDGKATRLASCKVLNTQPVVSGTIRRVKMEKGLAVLLTDKGATVFDGKQAKQVVQGTEIVDVTQTVDGDWVALTSTVVVAGSLARKKTGAIFVSAFEKDRLLIHYGDGKSEIVDRGLETLVEFFLVPGGLIVLTPEGYFSGDYAGLLGLELEFGGTRYPLNAFYDVFYRPDLVLRKLAGQDIRNYSGTTTLESALRQPPPTGVSIRVLPSDPSATRRRIAFSVPDSGGGIGEVRVFQNGKLVASDGQYARPDLTTAWTSLREVSSQRLCKLTAATDSCAGTLEVEAIAGEENEITIIAFNETNTVQSLPARVTFKSGLPKQRSRLWILATGINQFGSAQHVFVPLLNAARDARDFVHRYADHAVGLFEREDIHIVGVGPDGRMPIPSYATTRSAILAGLDEVAMKARPEDTFIWFVASHGTTDSSGVFGIVPSDIDEKQSRLITSNDILSKSQQIRAMTQLYIFDTCQAGAADVHISGLYDARISVLARNMGVHLYAGAQTAAAAADSDGKTNGLFTAQLLKALSDPYADENSDGNLSIVELGKYARAQTISSSSELLSLRRDRRLYDAQARLVEADPQTPFIMHFGKDANLVRNVNR